jgi:orotidine-5'-phosphate decarboxylase
VAEHFADRLMRACEDRGAPVCVGLDPVLEKLPDELRAAISDASDAAAVKAMGQWCQGVLEAVADHVPCVKPQMACFERYHAAGMDLYFSLVQRAKALGLLVIADGKRGDIGLSAAHYAAGLLAGSAGADALTVNAYLGGDGLEPFVQLAADEGKGLFALVRTSNPGGDALQSLLLQDGRRVGEAVGDLVAALGCSQPHYLGQGGYSLLGAVVGATKPGDAGKLRQRMPQQIFLVPGFGAQGGTADDVRACFDDQHRGALITASRSVTYPPDATRGDWHAAITAAAKQFKGEIAQILGR